MSRSSLQPVDAMELLLAFALTLGGAGEGFALGAREALQALVVHLLENAVDLGLFLGELLLAPLPRALAAARAARTAAGQQGDAFARAEADAGHDAPRVKNADARCRTGEVADLPARIEDPAANELQDKNRADD